MKVGPCKIRIMRKYCEQLYVNQLDNLNGPPNMEDSPFLISKLYCKATVIETARYHSTPPRPPCVSIRRALACKLHLGEQLSSQLLHPGRGAWAFLLSPASQLLSVVQHVHYRANQILCKLEDHNFTINNVSTVTNDLHHINKEKGVFSL